MIPSDKSIFIRFPIGIKIKQIRGGNDQDSINCGRNKKN
jgi:hypothetical protein